MPGPPPAEAGRDELWSWFLETRLLGLPIDAPAPQADAVLGVLAALGVDGTLPLLQRVFEREPTVRRARQLHELGDPRGIEHLLGELASANSRSRRAAAQILAELGERRGAEALVTILTASPRPRLARTDLNALDRFLESCATHDALYVEIIDFFVSLLGDATWQYAVFQALEREAHEDFGYAGARGINDLAERKAAIDLARRRARKWWSEHRESAAVEAGSSY